MAESYYVSQSDDDFQVGHNANTDAIVMEAIGNNTFIPALESIAKALVDTNGIPADATITEAVLFWYHSGYVLAGRGATYHRKIVFNDGLLTIFESTATPAAAGWHSAVIDSMLFGEIVRDGKTWISFRVTMPNTGQSRVWSIRTWDYDSSTAYACRLEIEYTLPSTGGRKYRIVGVG